jgi:hypothetical protein
VPDPPPQFERWRGLGRLLPADVRARVFEPALADLVHTWLTDRENRGSIPFGLRALVTCLGCLPAAGRGLFIRRGRLTLLGRHWAWALVALTVIGMTAARIWLGYQP